MKIVIAPDSFKESLTALEVAQSIHAGFEKVFPHAEFVKIPMADGGEGTVQSLVDATMGKVLNHRVIGPMGEKVTGFIGVSGDGLTAYIEMAAASGIHLVERDRRDALKATTFGTGELIKFALDRGVEKIIVGLGGSATNDAGVGMLQALGVSFKDSNRNEVGFGAEALSEIVYVDISDLDLRLKNVELSVACDVDNPLVGPNGASYVFGPQKGATNETVQVLDDKLRYFADLTKEQLGIDISDKVGSGAAGGLGGAFLGYLDTELRSGFGIVADSVRLEEQIQNADLVITGEGRIDGQSIHGKTPVGVAKVAKKHNLPVLGIAGSLDLSCVEVYDHGIDAVFSVVNGAVDLPTALAEAAVNIELTSLNIAKLWKLNINSYCGL
ncbi:glycerate kinase [Vibrio breoganii]|uniref:glycerate kinase n=1 Tax=Vibrio breoganii TaxID=553239 RepID=UPI000C858C90|nr:glycerate kinase [Vibrio breoganii]PMF98865.1 glycerate kinase [Vibrio breoganii]PMG32327.1 glycerate kinase [Vibrio breoganii]PMG82409.1 glycerate kinase [Vibrio breoganii]PMG92147.1 glycerate kinase [Vibrio breoganii]PMK17134.1 glycerate kinase [Vibrio breoganii]